MFTLKMNHYSRHYWQSTMVVDLVLVNEVDDVDGSKGR